MRDLLASVGYASWVLDALIVLPVLGCAAVLAAPVRVSKPIALAVTIAELLISLGLWWAFDPSTAAMQFEVVHPWIPTWGVSYHVGLDGISLFMVLLTTLTMPLAVLGSFTYIKTF